MAENGIGIPVDFEFAVENYEMPSDGSAAGPARCGRCWYAGRGIPVDFTVAAELFKKASDSNDADGANSFGCCLEWGESIDEDIECAVLHYRKAASQSHPHVLFYSARFLEYGKRIGQDLIRAVKHSRLSADLRDTDAQNSCGICLERGLTFNRIRPSRPTIISNPYSKAILTAQIISVSVWNMAGELRRTFDSRLNITNLHPTAAIPKAV
jgi:TPR repeat protein